jgi:hypothetical protein
MLIENKIFCYAVVTRISRFHVMILVHKCSEPLPTAMDLRRTSGRAQLLCVWVNKGLNYARFGGKAST